MGSILRGGVRVAFAAVVGFLSIASASAAEMTLYETPNFGGRHITVRGSVTNFDRGQFNDRAASLVIRSGFWDVCSDAYFHGRCQRFGPGSYPSLGGMTDKISSVRVAGDGPPPPRPPGPPPPPPLPPGPPPGPPPAYSGTSSIQLFERREFGGQSITLTASVSDLERIGFNDRADAAIVRGGVWRICTDARMQGNCQTFGPGRYNDLGPLGGKVSSVARVR